MTKRSTVLYILITAPILIIALGWYITSFPTQKNGSATFDGRRALADVRIQLAFGPRTPGSMGHVRIRNWMKSELEQAGWFVELQAGIMLGHPIYNVIAKRNSDLPPQIIIGAHYDTRLFSDEDPAIGKRTIAVPGANDGASGVAVLIELARSLPEETIPIWLVFFDAEDNGRIEGWDWTLGSQYFVKQLIVKPRGAIVVDMIGDADQNIYFEKNSDPTLNREIWALAADLGYENGFIPQIKHSMHDDHSSFLAAGIPAVDIIDFDYPYWHTSEDTYDKVSSESLESVGVTLWNWITRQSR